MVSELSLKISMPPLWNKRRENGYATICLYGSVATIFSSTLRFRESKLTGPMLPSAAPH